MVIVVVLVVFNIQTRAHTNTRIHINMNSELTHTHIYVCRYIKFYVHRGELCVRFSSMHIQRCTCTVRSRFRSL